MGRLLSKEEWRKRRQRKIKGKAVLAIVMVLILLVLIMLWFIKSITISHNTGDDRTSAVNHLLPEGTVVKKSYLTPNPYSRPQEKLKKVKGIVIHYTANPGTSAINNRNYFESLATKKTTSVSSHYVIGLEGEIVQCIPLNEISYASNNRNKDTISIECCHEDQTGMFNEETYNSLVVLSAALCAEFDLMEEDILRHYDVTGKACPLYYVEHKEEWKKLKEDIMVEKVRRKAEKDQATSE